MELPKDQPDQPVQPVITGSSVNLSATPAPQKSGKKLYLIIAIFLIVALIGGGAFYFLKSSGGDNSSESIPSLKKASGGLQGKLDDQELFLKIKPKSYDNAKKEIEESTDPEKKEKDPNYKSDMIAEFTLNTDNKGLYLFFPNKDTSFKEIRDSIISVDNKEEIQVMFAQWNLEPGSGKGQWMATEQNYYDKANIKELESETELAGAVVKKGQGVIIMAPANIMIPGGHDSTFSAGEKLFDWKGVNKGWVLLSAHGDTLGETFKDDCLNRVSTVFVQDNAKTANMKDAFVKVELTDPAKFKSTSLKDKGFYAVWVYVNDQKCGEEKKIAASFTVTGIATVPKIIMQNTAQDQTIAATVSGTNLIGSQATFDANPRFNGSTTADIAIMITKGTGVASETSLPLSILIKKNATPGTKDIVLTSKEGVTQTVSFTIQPQTIAPKTLSAPGKPTGTAGDGKVTLTWTEPTEKGKSDINNYKVTVTPKPNNGIATRSVDSNQKTFTFTGLNNGTSYTFRVKAQNEQEISPDSEASDPITPISLGPVVIKITPSSAKRGAITEVTITGTNLNSNTIVTYVPDYSIGALNGDITISEVKPSTDGNSIKLTITVPDSAFFGQKPIEVNTTHGSYNGQSTLFTVEASPLGACVATPDGETPDIASLLYNPTISTMEEDTKPFTGGGQAHFMATSTTNIDPEEITFKQDGETIDAQNIQKGGEINFLFGCITTFDINSSALKSGTHTITAKMGTTSASTTFTVEGMTSINPILWTFPINGQKISMDNRKFRWNNSNLTIYKQVPVTYNYRWKIAEGNLTNVEEFKNAPSVWTMGWDLGVFTGGDGPECRKENDQETIWTCPAFTLPTDILDSLKSDTTYTVGAQVGNGTIASEYSLTTFTVSNPQKELDSWLQNNPLVFEVGGKDGLAIESQNAMYGDVDTHFDIILDKTKALTKGKTFTVNVFHTYTTGGGIKKYVITNNQFEITDDKELKNINFTSILSSNSKSTPTQSNLRIPILIRFSDWNYWDTIPFTMELTDENGATAVFTSTYNGLKGPKLEVDATKMYYNKDADELELWIKNTGPGLIPASMLDKINLFLGNVDNGTPGYWYIDDLITKQLLLCSIYSQNPTDTDTGCMDTANDAPPPARTSWSNINWKLMKGEEVSYEEKNTSAKEVEGSHPFITEPGWVKNGSIMLYLYGVWAGDHELRFKFWHESDGLYPQSFGGNTPYTFTTSD